MEKELLYQVEKILQNTTHAEKKLRLKVISIVSGMIFLLATIIIIEFKEYSHNYTEYKIGINELGPKDLVWAGIMGTPPRYYDSDEKHGLGYREFDTREIRKALEEAGLNLIYRYMSPNRLEFEFERKHPICFYDKEWKNPKEYFKKKRHAILSIPRFYSGLGQQKMIFFRKGEKARFQKHIGSNGKINLNSLIQDTSLKTELIRKVEYDGPYANITYGKHQLDGTYYDYVKNKYKKNIDLVILHTNDQIIQMLRWKRFDYQFFDTLEYDDYPWMDGGKNGIETLLYDDITLTSIDDPNFVFHSVACGNHPLAKMAMPIINEVIKNIRLNATNYSRSVKNEAKLNPLILRPAFNFYMGAKSFFGSSVAQADKWYIDQFSNLKITPWPMFYEGKRTPENEIKKNMQSLSNINIFKQKENYPHWNLIETKNSSGEKSLLIINDIELKIKSEEEILQNRFFIRDFKYESRKTLDRKINFSDLTFPKIKIIKRIIVFARGIKINEINILKHFFEETNIKGIIIIEPSLQNSKKLLSFLSKHLEELRLYDAPLIGLSFSKYITPMKDLKVIDIQASSKAFIELLIEKNELISTIKLLPKNLEVFSIVAKKGLNPADFPLTAAKTFANKKFSRLKEFKMLNFYVDDITTSLMLNSLPLNLESLDIGIEFGEFFPVGAISSIFLEEFLNKRAHLNKLKRLHLAQMFFSLRSENKLLLPKSLEYLSLSKIHDLNDGNFHRILIPPTLKLKKLEITHCSLNDFSIQKLLSKLSHKVESIILSNNKLTGQTFYALSKVKPIEVDFISLQSNPINDFGIYSLSKLPWKIKGLDISNLKITDNSKDYLTSNNLWEITTLNISDNYLNYKSIHHILKRHGKYLQALWINNVLSINIKTLFHYIPNTLEILSLSGNLLKNEEIIYLIEKLPRMLHTLDISGNQISAKTALVLSKSNFPFTRFNFDIKIGDEEEGLGYILKTLSPFLIKLPIFSYPLSYNNILLLSKNVPPFLYSLHIPDLEKEECKILFSFLPDAIRSLTFNGNIKSKGYSLQELTNNFPSHLIYILINSSIPNIERDLFLSHPKLRDLQIYPQDYMPIPSYQLNKTLSLYYFALNGPLGIEELKNIVFPSTILFSDGLAQSIPKGLLNSFRPTQLINLRLLHIANSRNIETQELFDFFKKIPSDVIVLSLLNLNLKNEDVDTFIELLPKRLRVLGIKGNSLGVEGLNKFKEYKRKMEEKTGIQFLLLL